MFGRGSVPVRIDQEGGSLNQAGRVVGTEVPAVEVREVTATYRNGPRAVRALEGVSFTVGPGETCTLIGPSGCGKTTLLYILAGLLRPGQGQVLVAGRPISRPCRETALILQDFGLLPWKTAWGNVVLGLEIRRVPPVQQERVASSLLKKLGLWDFRDHYPQELSGGQRQRVAIARALALDPDLLLMDEPFSSLDALTREELQETFLEVWLNRNVSVVMVTHSIEEAVFLGQKILVMSGRPGRISATLENPLAGSKDYRKREEFHARCNLLRSLLEKGEKEDE